MVTQYSIGMDTWGSDHTLHLQFSLELLETNSSETLTLYKPVWRLIFICLQFLNGTRIHLNISPQQPGSYLALSLNPRAFSLTLMPDLLLLIKLSLQTARRWFENTL